MSFVLAPVVAIPRLAVTGLLTLGLAACHPEPSEPSEPPGPSLSGIPSPPVAIGYASPPPPSQPSIDPPASRDGGSVPGSDGTLAALVVSALSAEPDLNSLRIDVSAVDGTIYLRGNARDRETRRLATQVATSVDGVKRVQNELFVTAGS